MRQPQRWVTPLIRYSFALLLASCLLPEAQAEPTLLVMPFQRLHADLPRDLGLQTTLLVAKEIEQGGVKVLTKAERPATKAKAAAFPTGNPQAERRARRMVSRARQAMENGEIEDAVQRLNEAVQLLEKNAEAVGDLRVLAEAHFQRAIALFRDGQEEQADLDLRKSVHLDPDRIVTQADYPPIFVQAVQMARYEVLMRPRAELEIQATEGSRVLLDGRSMGSAPVRLSRVLPGQHWVRIEDPGAQVEAKSVQVPPSETTVLLFSGAASALQDELTPRVGVSAALAANRLEEQHFSLLANAGRSARADFVLVGAIFGTDTAYQIRTGLYQVRTGEIGRVRNIAFDLDLLSAEIEVYNLASDVQAQTKAAELAEYEGTGPWMPAPDFKPVRGRKASFKHLPLVMAAPRPVRKPAPIAQPMSLAKTTRAVKPKKSKLLPKDEMMPEDRTLNMALSNVSTPKKENEGGEDLWWVWVLVGVAAVGAGTAATVAVVSNQEAEDGNLTIRW